MNAAEIVTLERVTKIYDGRAVLNDISLTVTAGRVTGIAGPSGCGKSTLLSVIGHVIEPTRGHVLIDGINRMGSDSAMARARNETFGYVVQDFALVDSMSAIDNVSLPLRFRRPTRSRRENREAAERELRALGVTGSMHAPVGVLSGGERQRVAIARALIGRPRVILADEPTGALDSATGAMVLNVLRGLTGRGCAVVLVSHDEDVIAQCDDVVRLRDGARLTDEQ